MKKFFSFIAITFLFTGCSKTETQETIINNPYEIAINNELLSYYENKEGIPKSFDILEISVDNFQNNNNGVLLNEEDSIRCISITSKDVITYGQISIGDNVNSIESAFNYEYKIDDKYMVIFDDITEEDPTDQNKEDDWLWINYFTDGSKITKIQIYDVKFGKEMR